ncbi:MAG TPA: hypothetical protein VJN18_04795 [Polyangiaceae bacterium]|nr:hypothetical protein [Polyangiaceae bacterium]
MGREICDEIGNWDLSPAKFRHVSSEDDVKARASRRTSARKPKAAKAAVRARARDKKAPKALKKASHEARAAAARTAKASPSKSARGKPGQVRKPAGAKSALAAKPVVAKPVAPKVTPAKPVPLAPARAVPPSIPPPKEPARKSIKEAAGVSTDAVARRTGKSWDDWFNVLDSAGAATLDQRGVIAILAQKHGIGPWWQQMIAVGYESVRGKSDKPPASDGFRINSSCTLDAPLPRVFRLWNDAGERARWLADDRFVVRGATADKSIRARWGKGTSHVAVSFSEKSGRTEVSVEHHQIESSAAAEQMKAYWAKKLGLLEALAPRR